MPCFTADRLLFGGQHFLAGTDGTTVFATDLVTKLQVRGRREQNNAEHCSGWADASLQAVQVTNDGFGNGISCIATDQAGTVAVAVKVTRCHLQRSCQVRLLQEGHWYSASNVSKIGAVYLIA